MKRKILSILTALCLALTLLPATALAVQEVENAHVAGGYTFTINGVHISEAGYYTLDGAKLDTETGAAVHVTDPANKKIQLLNGTTASQFHAVFEWEHTAWEKEADGVYRYAQYKGYDTAQGGMAIREYEDYENISEYALEAMGWAVSEGLVTGTSSTTLTPDGSAIRAQVATIFQRFMEGVAK